MPVHEYKALCVEQQPGAPVFYLTSVPAAELLEWCDVPRAKGNYMAGYQRSLNPKRIEDLAEYLRLSPNNILPGAVIVAVDDDYVTVSKTGEGLFSVSVAEDARDFDTKLQELWGSFTTRLTDEELASAGILFTPGGSADGGGAVESDETNTEGPAEPIVGAPDGASSPSGGSSDGTGDDELPAEFVENDLDDEEVEDDDEEEATFPSSYLASLAQELSLAVADWNAVPFDRQHAIKAFIDGVSKPGLIIDGQHRVFGAKDVSEHDVVLPIVLLPGLSFAEQVFEFYVLNSKARPLKPTELRRIVSTSLTNQEINELYHRFRAAGIEAEEARWTLELNTRPESPFRGRIDFGYGESGAVIPENVADQVVRGFMKMPRKRYKQLINPLGGQWSDPKSRLEIFFWFWNAIKDVYADEWAAAEAKADQGEKPQLFMKVALLTLQTFVLDRFVTALPYRSPADDPPLKTQDEVAKMVKSTLTNLPADFFQREWKMKQIDTSEGRKALYESMEAVWNNQGRIHGNMALFRG
jgi:hypothetical protein